jgi:glycosyltransferase involved in cell wall biosynthesis
VRYLLTYLKFLLLAFLTCSRIMVKRSLDIVHIHNMPNFLIFSAIVPLLLGKKAILDIHDTVVETYSSKFGGESSKLFRKLFYRILCMEESVCCSLADRIICVNHIQRDALIKRGIPESKIMISMNVPDPKYFGRNNNTPYQVEENSNVFRLVYHGTLAKRLGIDITIQAVAKLIDKILNLEFYIFGTGDNVEELMELSKRLKLEKYVLFRRFVPLESLASILNSMHVGVVANRKNVATELMLPVKMLEYIALNIPIVAPRLKTIQYYFTDDMVSYFEPDNVDSLVDAVWYAYNNKAERIKKAENAKRFLEKYGWETHKWDLINLYKSLS